MWFKWYSTILQIKKYINLKRKKKKYKRDKKWFLIYCLAKFW